MTVMSTEMRSFLARWAKGKTPVAAGVLTGEQKDQAMFQDTKKAAGSNGQSVVDGGRTPSAKQVRWKLKTSGIELMTITPAVAEAMLEHNTKNRPMNVKPGSPGPVAQYAAQMRAGQWRLTFAPIVFSKSGRLQDGQHRLQAVIQSGVTVQFYVAFGSADENFAFMDAGKKRTPGDIFAINDVKYYCNMSSACRWLMAYDRDAVSGGYGLSFAPTAAQLYDYYVKNVRLQDGAWVVDAFAKSRLAPPSLMLAMHYICAQKSRKAADEFFEKVASGIGFASKSEPAYKLHKRLIENFGAAAKLQPIMIAAFTIKAWNAERAGHPLGVLKWRGEGAPDENFPKAQ